MNLDLYDHSNLNDSLTRIKPLARIAFAAACCERLLPNYRYFSQVENWGDVKKLELSLEYIWKVVKGQVPDQDIVEEFRQQCISSTPEADDFPARSPEPEATEVTIAIRRTLEACLDPTPTLVISIAGCITETLDMFVSRRDPEFDVDFNTDGLEKYRERIAVHPLTVKELLKQTDDLTKLNQAKKLDDELLDWLQTSSRNNGISLIGWQ